MWRWLKRLVLVLLALLLAGMLVLSVTGVPAPPGITAEQTPRVSWKWAWKGIWTVRRFQSSRRFAAWYGSERRMLVSTGLEGTVYVVDGPGAEPRLLTGLPRRARHLVQSREAPWPYFVYSLDEGGSELYRLFLFDLRTGLSTPLTQRTARTYVSGGFDPEGRRVAFASTERNGKDFDIYVVDVMDPSSNTMVYRAEGEYFPVAWSSGGGQLLVQRLVSHIGSHLFLLDVAEGKMQPIPVGNGDPIVLARATRARNAPVFYVASNFGGEFTTVHSLDPATGQAAPLTPELSWDVEDIETFSDGRTLALLVNEDAQHSLYLLDLDSKSLRRPSNPPGFIDRMVAHPTLPLLALDVATPSGVSGVWTYDLEGDRFDPWSVPESDSELPLPEVIHYPTFDYVDGSRRQISAVVAQPSGPFTGKWPVVIHIHGGPASQAKARPTMQYQFHQDAGIAVIAPNVRGSTGYGKTFASLDDQRNREDAVRDIGALLDWIAMREEFDPARVAIVGASYGGYMTLASLTHYSDRVSCGVDLFGISDIPTSLKESEEGAYPEAQRGEFGDERDPEMRAFLESISPARHAGRIRVPLLIYQGANDVRVKPKQSRDMVARIRATGGSVVYIESANEGHGIERPETLFYLASAFSEFLEQCLQ